jgi:SAM-dependent methyltransferase
MTRDPHQSCFAYSRMRLAEVMDPCLAPATGQRLLDVGCGTGHHLADLRQRGFNVTGVDGSGEMLTHARRINPDVELVQSDVARLPFDDASFDIVLCVEVARYLADPDPCLREIARVLRPRGLVLMTASPLFNLNGYALINRLAPLLPIRLTRLKQYFTTSRSLRSRLARAGFEAIQVHGVYWGPINWVERLAPNKLAGFLRRWERIDRALADRPILRESANMFMASAHRAG